MPSNQILTMSQYEEICRAQETARIELERRRRILEDSIFGGESIPTLIRDANTSILTQPPAAPQPTTPIPNHQRWTGATFQNVDFDIPRYSINAAHTANTPQQPQPRWPLGTVVKWNTSINGVLEHLAQIGTDLNNPLLRIEEYSDDLYSIPQVRDYASVRVSRRMYELKLFLDATPEEVNRFNKSIEDLRLCTERPAIGTVVKYMDRGESYSGKLALVLGHIEKDKIRFGMISNANIYTLRFNCFQIAKDQSKSFTPTPSAYCFCSNCNAQHEKQSSKRIEDNYFCCEDCLVESGFCGCYSCHEWHIKSQCVYTRYGLICPRCISSSFAECSDCGQQTLRVNLCSIRGFNYCIECESSITRLIRPYSYKPVAIYNKMQWENTRYLGIELEIEVADEDDREPLAAKIKEWLELNKSFNTSKPLEKLIYMKNDGSLDNGIEIVFHPFTLQSLHKNFPIRNFLQFLTDNNAEVNRRCGMHVHVSKEKLTNMQLIRGKWLFYKCEQFLKIFSEREEFNYCKFENKPTNDPYNQPYGRRTALNVAGSPKTLEIRMFQSTLEYAKFMANVQFSDAFVDYIQHGAGTAFLKTHTESQVWENFIDYCKRDGKYQLMTNYILRKAIV